MAGETKAKAREWWLLTRRYVDLSHRLAMAEAENARLRQALADVADEPTAATARMVARAALAGGEGKKET